MYEVFADLHVHIGRSENGKPIKITAARSLNFANIAKECADRKGINIVGIIDCASPYVIEDIENFLKTGDAYELKDGGIIYKDKVCILLGSEVETSEKGRNGKCGAAHNVCFFPHLEDIKAFSNEMSHHIKNITLSTQRSDISGYELIDIVEKYNGILIPAHIFTPFKSYYGNCTDRLENIFKEKYDIKEGVYINIVKNIPVSAGLAGGSTDGAAVLKLMNKLFEVNASDEELMELGLKLGADIPYCIKGGTALCEGIGEKITELKPFKDKILVLVKPGFGVSTKEVYKSFELDKARIHPKTDKLIEAMENDDLYYVANNMKNLLENVTLRKHNILIRIKEEMNRYGAVGSMMSGSGPSVFAFFDDMLKAQRCYEKMKENHREVFLTRTI